MCGEADDGEGRCVVIGERKRSWEGRTDRISGLFFLRLPFFNFKRTLISRARSRQSGILLQPFTSWRQSDISPGRSDVGRTRPRKSPGRAKQRKVRCTARSALSSRSVDPGGRVPRRPIEIQEGPFGGIVGPSDAPHAKPLRSCPALREVFRAARPYRLVAQRSSEIPA